METPAAFWERCCEALTAEARERGYAERCIGNTPEMVDEVLELIVSGAKRGTFSLPETLERAGKRPAPGDHVILTRHDGNAACLLRIDACELLPFDQVGSDELEIEAPAARDPRVWRDIHERYWAPALAARGQELMPGQPVLMQRFTLLAVARP